MGSIPFSCSFFFFSFRNIGIISSLNAWANHLWKPQVLDFYCCEVFITAAGNLLTRGLLGVSISSGVTLVVCVPHNYLFYLSDPICWYKIVPFWSLLWICKYLKENYFFIDFPECSSLPIISALIFIFFFFGSTNIRFPFIFFLYWPRGIL